MKLAVIVTHPIRYYIPLFRLLDSRGLVQLKVFYTFGDTLLQTKKYRPENWEKNEPDLPLFDGYDYEFVPNTAKRKSTFRFNGIKNPTLIEQIEAWSPSAVLVMGWNFSSHLKALRHFKGKIPVYFRGDSTLLDDHQLPFYRQALRHIVLKWVYRHIDKAFYVGTHNKDYYKKAGLKEDQLVFAGHAIDNARFTNAPGADATALELRRQLGLKATDFIFLFAGKFQHQKNPLLLLNAFKRSAIKDAHLVFIGAGPLANTLKASAQGYPNIHFIPMQPQSKMPAVYRLGDVFILPSNTDTWGLVINEALACSRAVIVSDRTGCAADLIKNGHNGYVVQSGDDKHLAELLQWFNTNRSAAAEMGVKGFEIIQNYTIEHLAAAIEETLKKDTAV